MIDSIKAYAMFTSDTALHKNSSSGGVFSLFAQDVIARGGVVFGAAFCDDFKGVEHIGVRSIEDLEKLRGSKYVRSDISGVFACVSELLEQGIEVLFSGTPCQVSALKKHLGQEYPNLLTVSVICHGTPKRSIWRDYVLELEHSQNSKITAVNFRDKSESWRKYRLRIQFESGKQYLKSKDNDSYLCGFLQNLTLEKSCFQCHFKGNRIESDIILGDFWGVERAVPELYHSDGTSLVIVRSEKGMVATELLLLRTKYKEVDISTAVNANSSLFCSAKQPEKYDAFCKAYDAKRCAKSIEKFLQKKNYILLLKKKLGKLFAKAKQ